VTVTLDDLRRFAVSRSFFEPLTLKRAVEKLGFVQADPIRAPARAQDLTLRHRVRNYRAGDLERRFASLGIEEDVFVNYGFVSSAVHALMHPRGHARVRSGSVRSRAQQLLAFVRERGEVHPREVDAYFAHGTVINYWGGSSSATTHLLDDMHYRGLLRVARRDRGIRIYAVRQPASSSAQSPGQRLDALVDVAVGKYAPLPAASLSVLVRRLRYAVPHLRGGLNGALTRARRRLAHARVEGIDWYWPAAEDPQQLSPDGSVRLLAPFDPVVWDRRRFELFWNWSYRFEAYTPIAKRKLGYYALPMLWRDRIVGWGNLTVTGGQLQSTFGYVNAQPRERRFRTELEAEIELMRRFLGLELGTPRHTSTG
jgi:uncharacterized protein YcaQ